jgi:hypothetical protein
MHNTSIGISIFQLGIEIANFVETNAQRGARDRIKLLICTHEVNRSLRVLYSLMGLEDLGR